MRISDHGELSNAEVDCFNSVRRADIEANKAARHAMDSTKDNLLLVTIRSLLARFN
ncbi:MAG: hypothetical protein ACOYOI_02075 [Chthoniobacterales bacterium]